MAVITEDYDGLLFSYSQVIKNTNDRDITVPWFFLRSRNSKISACQGSKYTANAPKFQKLIRIYEDSGIRIENNGGTYPFFCHLLDQHNEQYH